MASYKTGDIIRGCVTGITKYGVFVSLDNYYNGLIHISEISDGFVKNVGDFVNVGESIYVKILDIDEEESKMKLSIKDIDYKLGKPKKDTVAETEKGFSTLEKNLDKWIDEKIGEM